MKFSLTIEMDNDAFDDPEELPLQLRTLADHITDEPARGRWAVYDSNGNRVGSAMYIGRKEQ